MTQGLQIYDGVDGSATNKDLDTTGEAVCLLFFSL